MKQLLNSLLLIDVAVDTSSIASPPAAHAVPPPLSPQARKKPASATSAAAFSSITVAPTAPAAVAAMITPLSVISSTTASVTVDTRPSDTPAGHSPATHIEGITWSRRASSLGIAARSVRERAPDDAGKVTGTPISPSEHIGSTKTPRSAGLINTVFSCTLHILYDVAL
jgi:hypothetical protein